MSDEDDIDTTEPTYSHPLLPVGIHYDAPMSQYLQDPGLSTGMLLDLLERSPAHAKLSQGRRADPGRVSDATEASDLGSACHAVILGGEEAVAICDVTYPEKHKRAGEIVTDWKTGAAQAFRAEARAAGRYPILARKAEQLPDMVRAVRAALANHGDLAKMRTEVTLIWEEDGVRCRARLDAWLGDSVIDLKTTANAAPGKWERAMSSGGYDIQGAWQLRGLYHLTGGPERDFYCLAAEHSPPFGCKFFGLDASARYVAEQDIEYALALWRECEQRQEWPSYSTETHWVPAQTWREIRAAERAARKGAAA